MTLSITSNHQLITKIIFRSAKNHHLIYKYQQQQLKNATKEQGAAKWRQQGSNGPTNPAALLQGLPSNFKKAVRHVAKPKKTKNSKKFGIFGLDQ